MRKEGSSWDTVKDGREVRYGGLECQREELDPGEERVTVSLGSSLRSWQCGQDFST